MPPDENPSVPAVPCQHWQSDERVSICDWKQKCVDICGDDDLWSVSGPFNTRFDLSYNTIFGLSGSYNCWCCSFPGRVSDGPDPFADMGGWDTGTATVEEDTPAAAGDEGEASNSVASKVPKVKNSLDLSGLPAWVWVFSFLLPVVYFVISMVLVRGLPARKIYASPGGLTVVRALRCKGLSWLTLCQLLSGYLVVENDPVDGSEIWKTTTWFGGLAKGHDLLGICYGDNDKLSKRCRFAMMVFSILLASALSIAFGSTQLHSSSDCTYECQMGPRDIEPSYGEPGLSCKLDTFFQDSDDEWGDDGDEEKKYELPSGYLSSTGLYILLINQLYGFAIAQLLEAATRKGRSHSGVVSGVTISLMIVVVLATGIIAVVAAYLYLQEVGSCPGEPEVTKSVADTAFMGKEEFADNFLYGCGADATFTDPCAKARCTPVPTGDKVRVCVYGAVIGLAIDWFAYKPLLQSTFIHFLAKKTTKLDSFHMRPAVEEVQEGVDVSGQPDKPAAQPVALPMAMPMSQGLPMAQPMTQSMAQPMAMPMAQPVAQPVAQAMPMAKLAGKGQRV